MGRIHQACALRSMAALAFAVAALAMGAAAQASKGDAARGEAAYTRLCAGCHAIDANKVGPKHRGVVGRKVGGVDGFRYSEALAASRQTWDTALLERWLADPEATIPGQRMSVRVNDPQTRSDIAAYLATQASQRQ